MLAEFLPLLSSLAYLLFGWMAGRAAGKGGASVDYEAILGEALRSRLGLPLPSQAPASTTSGGAMQLRRGAARGGTGGECPAGEAY